ncbi:hypothetical protein [Paracoccus binzhouensis]|uniref:hypothetical protein n=1 Tax=Paracoccus binzhouensis TaxID=2796149 RepID=UPI0018EEEF86|nr:hypothetical protein [Paracoccus binzhouensis]
MKAFLKLCGLVAALSLAGCVEGPAGPAVSGGGIASAVAGVQRFCVAHGPDFAGSEAALRAAGARMEGREAGRASYRLPNGDFVNLNRAGGRPQCNYLHAGAAPLAVIGAAMRAQPGLRPVPHGVERIDTGRGIVSFQNLWTAPATGVVIAVAPGMTAYPSGAGFTGFAVEAAAATGLRPSRTGQMPVVEMR